MALSKRWDRMQVEQLGVGTRQKRLGIPWGDVTWPGVGRLELGERCGVEC